MISPTADLQRAIYKRLANDAGLQALLGGVRVFDHMPSRVAFPYIVLGRASAVDWSTATEEGSEHSVTVHVWSEAHGRDEVHGLMEKVRELLAPADLALSDHYLVNLTLEFSESRRGREDAPLQGVMRFRAVTEPVNG